MKEDPPKNLRGKNYDAAMALVQKARNKDPKVRFTHAARTSRVRSVGFFHLAIRRSSYVHLFCSIFCTPEISSSICCFQAKCNYTATTSGPQPNHSGIAISGACEFRTRIAVTWQKLKGRQI